MTTLVQLRRLIRSRLGVPVSDDFFTDDVVTDLANMAVQSVDTEQRWPWMERADDVTIDPDGTVPTEATWRATRVLVVGLMELGLATPADLVRVTHSDVPAVYGELGNRLVVRPIPPAGTTATHIWYAFPTPLVGDGDEPEVPDAYVGAIVAKAAELGSARESDQGSRSAHAADYKDWIQRMQRDVRRTVGPTTVRVRPGGWV